MIWCKPKYSVCDECKVHFEPATGYDRQWGNLCPTHRKPVIEIYHRKQAVMLWAGKNWERLEPEAQKELAVDHAANMALQQSALKQMAQGQQGNVYGLGSLGIGNIFHQ